MQKMVLVVLADHENTDTGLCFPSVRLLADECGMSERSVSNQIAKLSAAGLISIERFNHTTNRYILNKPDAPVAKADARRSEPDANRASKPINNQQTNQEYNQKEIITITAREDDKSVFTEEHQAVFDWAKTHKHWRTACLTMQTFLFVYEKGGMKSQYDEHKKARESWSVNGLQSEKSFTKKSEVNHATPQPQNQPKQSMLDDEKIRSIFDKNASAIKKELDEVGYVYILHKKVEKSKFQSLGLIEKSIVLKPSQTAAYLEPEPENDYPEMRRNKMNEFFGNTSINELTNKLLVNKNIGVNHG